MLQRTLILLAVAALLAAPAAASTPNQGPRPWDSAEDGASPSDVTRSVKCTIEKVEEPWAVELFDVDAETRHFVELNEKVTLTAKRKKDFGGRKKLGFSDLAEGQLVKLTYRVADGQIVRLQVLGKD